MSSSLGDWLWILNAVQTVCDTITVLGLAYIGARFTRNGPRQ